jgi:protease I
MVQLAEPKLKGQISLEEALARRRSVRQFTGQPLKMADIAQLAWAGQGITEPQKGLRTAPSAGQTYPVELYFATQDGLFVYRPQGHLLEQVIDSAEPSQRIRQMLGATAGRTSPAEAGYAKAGPQSAASSGGVTQAGGYLVLAGSVKKLSIQFREDARKYMLLEAGHIAQNIQLQAVCLDLGSVTVGGFNAGELSRICKLSREFEPIYIICVGYPLTKSAAEASEQQKPLESTASPPVMPAKRAVLIVASQNFQDEELFATKRVLDGAGVETTIASTRLGAIRGMLGGTAEAQLLINQVRVDDYDAIVFIGGSGAVEYFGNPIAVGIAREAARRMKVLAAICIAPSVLADAGVLTGVRATSFLSERERLVRAGAIYTGAPVERDRFIITGSGPLAAAPFGQAILDALSGR